MPYTCRPAGALVSFTVFAINISPRWGLDCGDFVLPYTLRSAGAQELDTPAFYRHIAPLERKIENLPEQVGKPQ